jgi:hypothetical protein
MAFGINTLIVAFNTLTVMNNWQDGTIFLFRSFKGILLGNTLTFDSIKRHACHGKWLLRVIEKVHVVRCDVGVVVPRIVANIEVL